MTDTNQNADAVGSTAIVDASPEEAGDANRGERQGSLGSRRRFLAAVSAASAATLAGCPGSSDSGQTTTPASDGDSATTRDESGETATDTSTPQPENGVRLPAASLAELQLGVVGVEEVTVPDEGGS